MAGKSATLTVKILTDASGAGKGLEQAATGYQKFQNGVDKLVPAAAATVGAIALVGAKAVESASRTEQAMGALESVFGKNAKTVKGWAATAADSVGLAESEYSELSSVIGAQLGNLGLSADAALGGTKDLITLGADLAATFGGSTADAVSALSSALRGEADPAERYGLTLSQTAVNAKLAEKGLDKLTGEALSTAKTQVLLEMATEQAGGAMGQFARESNTASGAQARANAQFENAASALGEALLPMVTAVASKLAVFAKWVSENSTLVTILVGVIGAIAAIILVMSAAMKVAAIAQWAMNSAMFASPITWIILAVVALVAAIILLWTNSEAFRDFFIKMWKAIVNAVEVAWKWIVDAAKKAWDVITSGAKALWTWLTSMWNGIQSVAVAVWNAILGVVQTVWGGIRAAISTVINWINTAINAVRGVFDSVWNGILASTRAVWNALSSVIQGALNAILNPIRAIQNAFNAVVDAIRNVINWLSRIKIPSFGSLTKLVGGKSAPAAASSTPAAAVRAPRLGATAGAASGGGVTIIIQGGLDGADTTARRIAQLLEGRAQRVGGVRLVRRTAG